MHGYVTHKMFAFNTIRLQFNGDFWVKRWPNEMRTLNKHSWTRVTPQYNNVQKEYIRYLAGWLADWQALGSHFNNILLFDDEDDVVQFGFNFTFFFKTANSQQQEGYFDRNSISNIAIRRVNIIQSCV